MPTMEWLKREFDYGYDSGNVVAWLPNRVRRSEERRIGGSYRQVFRQAIKPYLSPDSQVLELGPGRGAWSRAILEQIPQGRLTTVDFQDVSPWLQPERYDGRLRCCQVSDNSFSCVPDDSMDYFWSMGVLCHNNQTHIGEILGHSLHKVRSGGYACHQYGDWQKLNRFGWERGGVPVSFQEMNDDEIWWPRNQKEQMAEIAKRAGWIVVEADLGLLRRDGLILLKRP